MILQLFSCLRGDFQIKITNMKNPFNEFFQNYSRPLIIAEIGTSHQGNLEKLKQMVAAVKQSGADCLKSQLVYADEILHPESGLVPLPNGNIPLYDYFKSLEKPLAFYQEMQELCRKHGLLFLCTPFGLKSAEELKNLKVQAYKVASPELNHFPLLEKLAEDDKPVFLSSGVSLLADIEKALLIFKKQSPLLMHCVTSYPAPEEDYNLGLLPLYRKIFGIQVGVSDHSLDPFLIPLLAMQQGAVCIEKHFTLDNKDSGPDDPIALNPENFSLMTSKIKQFSQSSHEQLNQFLDQKYGKIKIKKILGSGKKELAPSEATNYFRTRRSIHALCKIESGETFSKNNTALLRTEKKLRPGLMPEFYPLVLGKRAIQDIPAGEGIRTEDIK